MNQQAQAQSGDSNAKMIMMLVGIFVCMFIVAPFYLTAFILSSLAAGIFKPAVLNDLSMTVATELNMNPVVIGLLAGLLTTAIIFIITVGKGWWSVHKRAGKAITDFEANTYKIRLAFYLTLLLTFVMFLIKLAL